MATGKIKWFNPQKGYGFIVPDQKGRDVFLHQSELKGLSVDEGDRVSYDVADRQGRNVATNIKRL